MDANSTLVENCTVLYDPNLLYLGKTFSFLWVAVSLLFLYLFACKLKFTPHIYLWLSFYIVGFLVWLCSKLLQDAVESGYKCLIINCLGSFCLIFLSLIMLGIMLDRYIKLQWVTRSGMNRNHVLLCVCLVFLIAVLVACLDGISMGSPDALQFNGTESFKCRPAATLSAFKVQLYYKTAFCLLCTVVALVLTGLTVHKILGTSLKKKHVAIINILSVTAANVTVWVFVCFGLLKQAFDENLSLCPSTASTFIYPYAMQVTVIVILFVYMYTSQHIKGALVSTKQSISAETKKLSFKSATPVSHLSTAIKPFASSKKDLGYSSLQNDHHRGPHGHVDYSDLRWAVCPCQQKIDKRPDAPLAGMYPILSELHSRQPGLFWSPQFFVYVGRYQEIMRSARAARAQRAMHSPANVRAGSKL
nr:Ov5 putative G-protein coupled receptor (GPCR) [Ovine gammaherpesvirus 2]